MRFITARCNAFIDEIQMIVGAGRAEGIDAAGILPALARDTAHRPLLMTIKSIRKG